MSVKPFFTDQTTVGSFISADIDHDGVNEVIAGAPRGQKPYVRVYKADGTLEKEFLAYAETFTGGVNITACDLVPGGDLELVTGAGYTGSPHIRTFDSTGNALPTNFDAYNVTFKGGANVACGDVDADGQADIVTGPGVTGGPDIKVFSNTGTLKYEMFTGSASDPVGAYVAVGNIDGTAGDEIVTSPVSAGIHGITTLAVRKGRLSFLTAFPVALTPSLSSPITLADVSADPGFEIAIVKKTGPDITVQSYTENGVSSGSQKLVKSSLGVVASLGAQNGTARFVAANTAGDTDMLALPKFIKVDISEQKLTAYEYGVEVKNFLVSTAKPGFKTPIGKTTVMAKIPIMDYVWNYGPGDKRNYNLPNVKWNLRVFPHIYIHSAYWHHNFGHPMSHGCINTSIPDADWIFHWAEQGTAVETVP